MKSVFVDQNRRIVLDSINDHTADNSVLLNKKYLLKILDIFYLNPNYF